VTLQVGLIGCGRWGRLILRDLLALGAEVQVVAPSPANRREAVTLGAARAVAAIDDLDGPVEGFVIASPTSTHAAVMERLLRTGRPLFVEKPMTNDLAAARRLVAAAGDRIFVMDKWRYHAGVEALAAAAKSGELGEILAVRSYRLGWGHPHRDVDALWILLPHDLAIALEILGHLPAAAAALAPVPGRAASDFLAVLREDPGGPQVTIEIGTSHPVTRRAVVVVGSRKAAQLADSYDDRIAVAEGAPDGAFGAPLDRPAAGEPPLRRELHAFLDHLRGGPPPRSSAAEGLLIVERIAALRRLAALPD
jgi:predicted dehydrogenase